MEIRFTKVALDDLFYWKKTGNKQMAQNHEKQENKKGSYFRNYL